jgi:hypothetical protein
LNPLLRVVQRQLRITHLNDATLAHRVAPRVVELHDLSEVQVLADGDDAPGRPDRGFMFIVATTICDSPSMDFRMSVRQSRRTRSGSAASANSFDSFAIGHSVQ